MTSAKTMAVSKCDYKLTLLGLCLRATFILYLYKHLMWLIFLVFVI